MGNLLIGVLCFVSGVLLAVIMYRTGIRLDCTNLEQFRLGSQVFDCLIQEVTK